VIEISTADLKRDASSTWATASEQVISKQKKQTVLVTSSLEGIAEVKTHFFVKQVYCLNLD
jgi:hypothetical protein